MSRPDGISHLVEEGIIDAVHARLMSGKEATVYVVEREGHLGAAKVYKARDERTFKKTASYVEGRNQTRNSRDRRAMQNKSSYGRGLIEDNWQDMEFHALRAAFDAGVRVPEPYFLYENVLFMELIVDSAGAPAARARRFCLHGRRGHRAASGGLPSGEDAARCRAHSRRSVGLQRPDGSGRSDHHRHAPGRRGGGQQQRPSDPAARPAKPDRAPGPLRRAAPARGRLRRRALSPPRARDSGHRHGARGRGARAVAPAAVVAAGVGAATPSGVAPAATRGNARAAARRRRDRPGGPTPPGKAEPDPSRRRCPRGTSSRPMLARITVGVSGGR